MLVALAVWPYVRKRYPMRYEAAYWGAVFPLGMYSAATHQMSLALGLRKALRPTVGHAGR